MFMFQKPTAEEKKKAEEIIRRSEQQGCHFSAQQVKDIGKKVAAEIKIEEHEERQRRAHCRFDMIIRAARQRG
ncbi:MAG: hypothetical protein SPL08_02955 [Pseudomonadota bacterium]|nr:hypothetical protein [Pseudomonadota bacterium]